MSSGIKFGAIMSAQQQLVNRKDKAMSSLEWGRTCTYTADMLPNFTPRELRAQCTKNKLNSGICAKLSGGLCRTSQERDGLRGAGDDERLP